MLNIEEILRNDDYNNFNKADLLDIILILRNDLKYHKYRKDNAYEQMNSTIATLKNQIQQEKIENARLSQINKNFHNTFARRLTIMERIKGQIDLSNKNI